MTSINLFPGSKVKHRPKKIVITDFDREDRRPGNAGQRKTSTHLSKISPSTRGKFARDVSEGFEHLWCALLADCDDFQGDMDWSKSTRKTPLGLTANSGQNAHPPKCLRSHLKEGITDDLNPRAPAFFEKPDPRVHSRQMFLFFLSRI